MPRLRHLLPFIVTLALLIPAVVPFASATTPSRAEIIATLDPVQGLVQYREADAPETAWQTVTRRTLVSEGDWIRTDGAGLAYLRFFEGIQTDILPNSVLRATTMQLTDDDVLDISLDALVGNTFSTVEQTLDAEVRYEIHTPSAVIAVRGTSWWTLISALGLTQVLTVDGNVETYAYLPTAEIGSGVNVPANQEVTSSAEGVLSPVIPIQALPTYPPAAPLAPETCGNMICEAGEEGVCPVDCLTITSCGNGVCDYQLGEGPITCATDCIPPFPGLELAPLPTTPSQPQSTEPCTVQTSSATVAVRVGPGYNRGVRDYLPPNQAFPVLGEGTGSDGSLWWQIDIPAYEQAWVDQAEVVASGNCDLVGDVAAPPIVAPPPPGPGPSDDDDSGDDDGGLEDYYVSFVADRYRIVEGECVTVSWDVRGIREVYYMGEGVVGQGARVECPYDTAVYRLLVVRVDGAQVEYKFTVEVVPYFY
ncbi:MAG: FecR domain-containing protein [Chloroflexi bacterium]|nr:FecR domain-containing protein [Chloroflexota bacterium]